MNQSLPTAAETGNSPGLFEFVALMAFAMSLGALSIDAMLPAFYVAAWMSARFQWRGHAMDGAVRRPEK